MGNIETLVQIARSGQGIISFPTDTVPALAVRPDQADLIFQAKQRSLEKPLILMGATSEALWPFVKGSPQEQDIWQQIAQQYWPGALTLVLPTTAQVAQTMNPTNPSTLGIRVPNCAIAQTILQQTGPLATTSANLSGQAPLLTMAEIATQFPQVTPMVSSDSHKSPSAVPSTVLQWQSHGQWKILRQGAIKLELKS